MGPASWARWELPALLGTLVVALVLRLNAFSVAPPITDNGDELAWSWQGLGLITRGVPYGWSNLLVYAHPVHTTVNGKPFEIVHPFLDHPPIFGLIVGGAAWLQGARQLTDVTAPMIRPVPIVFSIVALCLAFLLGRRGLGAGPAILGTLLLATAPAAVLVQRQVEAETLLAPLLLGGLLLVPTGGDRPPRAAAAAGLLACCAIAPMVKVSGVAVAAVIATVLLSAGRWRLAGAALAAGLLGTAAFFAYGAFYDWDLFLRVIAGSEAQRYGVLGVYQFISAPAGPSGANQQLRDGWWLLGWLALVLVTAFRGERRIDLVAWPILGYAVVIMLLAEHVSVYGWFRVTVYPLVYLLAGWLAWRAVSEPSAISLLLFVTVGSASVLSPLLATGSADSWTPSPYLLMALLGVFVGPTFLVPWLGQRKAWIAPLARHVAVAALTLTLTANVSATVNLSTIYRSL